MKPRIQELMNQWNHEFKNLWTNETTNSRTYGSMYFVETRNIGTNEQKYFHNIFINFIVHLLIDSSCNKHYHFHCFQRLVHNWYVD
jgi:hypothetical protein